MTTWAKTFVCDGAVNADFPITKELSADHIMKTRHNIYIMPSSRSFTAGQIRLRIRPMLEVSGWVLPDEELKLLDLSATHYDEGTVFQFFGALAAVRIDLELNMAIAEGTPSLSVLIESNNYLAQHITRSLDPT